MNITGMGVLLVQTRDMKRSLDFYENVLGLHVNSTGDSWSELVLAGVRIGLHAPFQEGSEPLAERGKGWTVGFEVDDIAALKSSLKEAGVWVSDTYHEIPSGVILDFCDPEGFPLQACQQGIKIEEIGSE